MKKAIVITIALLLHFSISAQVEPLIENNWQTFMWPYNAYYPEYQNGPNGHIGNACGYTCIARVLHYWEYPSNGNGVLDFDDYFGNHWYIDLENMNLDYADMPFELDWDDPEPVYHETAMLFLACGAIGEDITIGFTDGIFRIPEALQEYMNYSEDMEVVQRWDYTREEWMNIFKNELDNGRPIIIDGRTPESPAPWEPGSWEGHFFVCDGYNESDEFYTNYMFGGISGYYDIDAMGNYSAYHRAIINMEPFNVGIDDEIASPTVYAIYPNPVSNELRINLSNKRIQPVKIELLNSRGQVVMTIAERTFCGNQTISFNTASLPAGIYFLKVINRDKHFTEQVVVTR